VPMETVVAVDAYADAVDEIVANQPFPFAEAVARRAREFFVPGVAPAIKASALRATLIAAVTLNRYSAMDAFDVMLVQCKDADATAVAAMLDAEIHHYRQVADRVPRNRLDPAIRPIHDRVRA